MVAVVAGFYLYARYRVQRAVRELPDRLGVNIQQNTQGFTYSQAVGGHTIYSITASNAVRYKQGGRAELHDVKIVSYGRNSDRMDEITGDDFEYDAQSGDVTAKGQVGIQLQAVEPGSSVPGNSPKKIGSPVHLDTSGLVFNQKTGIAETAERIDFQLPQGTGSAVGATYDSKKNTLDLHSDIRLLTSGPKPMNLRAASAVFQQETNQLTLADLRGQSGIRRLDAQRVVLHLRDDNTVERAHVSGEVNMRIAGQRPAEAHASDGDVVFGPANKALSARLEGGVTWHSGGPNASQGTASRVAIAFTGNNKIKSAQLRDNVDLVQPAEKADASDSSPRSTSTPPVANTGERAKGTEFRGDGLDLAVLGGTRLQKANSVGASQIVLNNFQASTQSAAVPAKGRTVITASRFDADFSPDNHLSSLIGTAPVKIVSSTQGQADRVSQSHDLLVTFNPGKTQSLKEAVQTGNVQIDEGPRSATADKARFDQASDTMDLTGKVHYKDNNTGSTLTCNSLTLNRATGETVASGDVKTTYDEQKTDSPLAVSSHSQAVHITASHMVEKNSTGVVRFSGSPRLWQGGNIIQGPEIEFNRKAGTMDAQAVGSSRVSTVFVEPNRSGKAAPVEVTSDRLHYDETARRALLDGAVVLRSADSTLRANRAVVLLKPAETKPAKPASNAPSAVQTIEATGSVQIQQLGRRATGSRLLYTADEEKFVLTGTPGAPPSIFDAEHGQVTGVSLTFFSRDDRVLVDSSNSTSISQTRLKK